MRRQKSCLTSNESVLSDTMLVCHSFDVSKFASCNSYKEHNCLAKASLKQVSQLRQSHHKTLDNVLVLLLQLLRITTCISLFWPCSRKPEIGEEEQVLYIRVFSPPLQFQVCDSMAKTGRY